jgi:hypothetical protein
MHRRTYKLAIASAQTQRQKMYKLSLCLHVITIPSTIFSLYDNGIVMVELFVLLIVATAIGGRGEIF